MKEKIDKLLLLFTKLQAYACKQDLMPSGDESYDEEYDKLDDLIVEAGMKVRDALTELGFSEDEQETVAIDCSRTRELITIGATF